MEEPCYVKLKTDASVPTVCEEIECKNADMGFFMTIQNWAHSSLRKKYI